MKPPHHVADQIDNLEIYLRAYVAPNGRRNSKAKSVVLGPSRFSLAFDTETTTDHLQNLRVGTYLAHNGVRVCERGVFHDPQALNSRETELVKEYCKSYGLKLQTLEEFVEITFYRYAYQLRGTVIGFNLPFDLARIALKARIGRRGGKKGFSLKLFDSRFRPPLQVVHLSSRNDLIQFCLQRAPGKGMRRRGFRLASRRGCFVDVKNMGSALLGGSDSLETLAKALQTKTQKTKSKQHGHKLTAEYLDYAVADTQVTWECYAALNQRLTQIGLPDLSPQKIKSEATIGKAYLSKMGVQPLLRVQPKFPPRLFGIIMSTYFGGRSEVGIRKQLTEVAHCDFLSMYPTVCALMGLWKFVIAEGIFWKTSTNDTRKFLDQVCLEDVQRPNFWLALCTLVLVEPDDDIFPVRAAYDGAAQATIGCNGVKRGEQQWFTLADCIASKLFTGKSPRIVKAITFQPKKPQANLKPIVLDVTEGLSIDPYEEDFFTTLIRHRNKVKKRAAKAVGEEKTRLNRLEKFLKLVANSTSYGINVETNVERLKVSKVVKVWTGKGTYDFRTLKQDVPGKFFNPLLGTVITSAARLMLAITETLINQEGLGWALCDTDSMAIAKPTEMAWDEFNERVEKIRAWFRPLIPMKRARIY